MGSRSSKIVVLTTQEKVGKSTDGRGKCFDDEVGLHDKLDPEIISNALTWVDTSSLKTCRLVSQAWNKQATLVLCRQSDISISTQNGKVNHLPTTSSPNRIAKLMQTLDSSPSPLFFRQLFIDDVSLAKTEVETLLTKHGQHLVRLECTCNSNRNETGFTPRRILITIPLLHNLVTNQCPNLECLNLNLVVFQITPDSWTTSKIPSLSFTLPLPNLKAISVTGHSFAQPDILFNYLAEIVTATPNLIELATLWNWDLSYFYAKLAYSQHVTNLQRLTLQIHCDDNQSCIEIALKIGFKNLKSLTIHLDFIDANNTLELSRFFHSVMPTLKILKLISFQNSQRHRIILILRFILDTLKNLQRLEIIRHNLKKHCVVCTKSDQDAILAFANNVGHSKLSMLRLNCLEIHNSALIPFIIKICPSLQVLNLVCETSNKGDIDFGEFANDIEVLKSSSEVGYAKDDHYEVILNLRRLRFP